MGEVEYLVGHMLWFAHGLGVDVATVRKTVKAVLAEKPGFELNDQIAEVRWRLMRAAGDPG